MPLLVRSMTHESAGVLSVELVDPDGRDLPTWEPGSHLDLRLPGGLSRQYSLAGDPHDRRRYRLGILREEAGRGGSAYVHEALARATPSTSAARATTSGWSRRRRTSSSRAASGSPRSCRCWPPPPPRAPTGHCSTAAARRRRWPSPTSWRGTATGSRCGRRTRTGCWTSTGCSAPRAWTRWSTAAARRRCSERWSSGWPPGRPAPCTWSGSRPGGRARPGRRARPRGGARRVRSDGPGAGGPLDPRRAPGGGRGRVSDCREGICGTCEVKVIEGEVDHRDFVLSEPEKAANSCMMVCVSRACGKRLVLGV